MFLLASERVNIIQRENLQINQSISTTAITFKMAATEQRNCVRIQHRASCKINKYLREKTAKTLFI